MSGHGGRALSPARWLLLHCRSHGSSPLLFMTIRLRSFVRAWSTLILLR